MNQDYIVFENKINPHCPLEASGEFLEVMKTRRSVREFSPETVDRQLILNAIETAGSAPSGANSQPWFFALIESQEIKDQVRFAAEKVENQFYHVCAPEKWLSDLKPLGTNEKKGYLSEAPFLIAVFKKQARHDEMSYYPGESTGIATGLLLTSLHLSGLATLTHTPRPMNFINNILGLDDSHRPYMLIITGYPKKNTLIPNIQKKQLSEICAVY